MPKFTCYTVSDRPPALRPAPVERDWMAATPQGFAQRCLPLNIANACGWEVLCEASFEAWWDGGVATDAISLVSEGDPAALPVSHFGSGVLTFHLHGLFRTSPGLNLLATGPFNRPKDAIAPLTGVIETDWAPYTFTMNWRFTRKDTVVRFAQGEPFGLLIPLDLAALEGLRPDLRPVAEEPSLKAEFEAWRDGRNRFNAGLAQPGSPAARAGWQKDYFRGRDTQGRAAPGHRTRLRLRPFAGPGPAADAAP